jgi:HKD family nuclease
LFYNQPLSIRFGTELLRNVEEHSGRESHWDSLDIAVAWVRSSGLLHLSERLTHFLVHGGHLSFVVGIDLENTTREGLQGLLDLEQHGHSETFVYHNESSGVFHPKLFLFRNEEEARLIVGSNNLTESGLYTNVEAGLQLDTEIDSEVIGQALDALSSWKDTSSRLSIRLDDTLLARLSAEGYVPDEATARARANASRSSREARRTPPIFGSRRFSAPARARPTVQPTTATPAVPVVPPATPGIPSGTVLLMRLRKASVTDRPTQTQIPFRVVDTFFTGATAVRSIHSGENHGIIAASARGGRNTVKLEIPEMRNFIEPVARFERIPMGISYEVYDVGSPKGNQIMGSLQQGQANGTTQMSVSNAARATWWRFI